MMFFSKNECLCFTETSNNLGFLFQLHILVSPKSVKLNVDCQEVAEKEMKPRGNTSTDGYQVLGKMSKSIGSIGESATVSSIWRNRCGPMRLPIGGNGTGGLHHTGFRHTAFENNPNLLALSQHASRRPLKRFSLDSFTAPSEPLII